MGNLPTGTVTFLFTDIEGSTRKWEQHPDAMDAALARHDGMMRAAIEQHNGHVFKTIGDAFCAAFPTASDAVAAVIQAQKALATELTEAFGVLSVRAGIHTGEARERDNDYFGPALNRVARLQGIGHGGQTLLSQASAALICDALPEGVWLADLGSHRLKDLGQPEHVWQLCLPDQDNDFPPVRSLQAFANNLPLQVTSFVGREQEMVQVKEQLQISRMVTLIGAGGGGKTRLALQVAADLIEQYGDGVWLVELAALSNPGLVPQAVASALGIREEPGRSLTETLTEYLRPKKTLLLLDNCEHLVGACASLVQTILQVCPSVQVLATSREALNIAGEQPWRVPTLSQPDPNRLPREEKDLGAVLLDYDAVRLFVDRARVQKGDFVLSRGNAEAVAQVCHRLDGIPLAIELAAARVRVLPVEQIAIRLDDRFRLLTGGTRTALPRQQTLRALIDWSYDLLNAKEKAVWQRLSVFAGGWTLSAAEAVCASEGIEEYEVLDLLTSVTDKSLVVYEEQEDGTARYRLLETIRQYGQDRLNEGEEAEAVRDRQRDYFLALAEEAELQLTGAEAGVWLSRLETEHDNLRAALTWCAQATGGTEAGLRLSGALWRFWEVRGHLSEGRQWLDRSLARAAGGEASQVLTKALHAAGALAESQGDFSLARTFYDQSLDLFRQLGNQRGIAVALNGLGGVAHAQGDYGSARTFYEQSLELFRQMGNQRIIAGSLNNLGLVAHAQGDYGSARTFYEQSLELFRQMGNQRSISASLGNLGLMASDQGDYHSARTFYEQSLEIRRQIGDQKGIANSLSNLGIVARVQGDYGSARILHEQSLEIKRQIGDQQGIAVSLGSLGNVARDQGDYHSARILHEQSLEIKRQIGDQKGIANSLSNLGSLAYSQGDYRSARIFHDQSLDLFRQMGDQQGIAYCLEGLAGVASSQGQHERGVRLWSVADALRTQIGAPLPPNEQQEQEQKINQTRQTLRNAAFSAAWAAGRAMTLEQAVEYAQADDQI